MYNLYMSTKLCRLALEIPQLLTIHWVMWPTLIGVLLCVKQDEVNKKTIFERVQNTVKVALLWGDSICKYLVCVSLYETKPAYLLCTDCSEAKWILKHRKVFLKNTQQVLLIPFYFLNIVDYYYYNMGGIYISDQLRNVYKYYSHWYRNIKWWWDIWWSFYQFLPTNYYFCYIKLYIMMNSKRFLSHYGFIDKLFLAFIEQYL